MNSIAGFDMIFPREYLRAALVVSLLSVWVLVGLFYYLNRYTKRSYFTIWTAAWLFYALWLTLGITTNPSPESFLQIVRQWCVGISAIFSLWGVYLATYPFSQKYESLTAAGILVSAVLQLFIAVSMIVLVLEEARYK